MLMKTKLFGIAAVAVLALFIMLTTIGSKHMETKEENPMPEAPPRFFYTAPSLPETISFMDEEVPLHRFDVMESLERELLVNSYFHSQTFRLIKLAPRFFRLIDPILAEEGVPADFRYLAVAESGLNPKAASPSGAVGLWQFMRSAASDYKLEVSNEVDERYHIEKSTRAACRFLKDSYKKYGSWPLVAASYNAGRASVDRQLARQKVKSYFDLLMSEETERYVYRILALKLIMENPSEYGFLVTDEERYSLWNTRKVEISGPVSNLADFAISQGTTYKMLKYYNPWLRDNTLANPAGKVYVVDLPGTAD
jgi:membrane-bound lytic murein transglycosylase D